MTLHKLNFILSTRADADVHLELGHGQPAQSPTFEVASVKVAMVPTAAMARRCPARRKLHFPEVLSDPTDPNNPANFYISV